jgi:hypothetical protein
MGIFINSIKFSSNGINIKDWETQNKNLISSIHIQNTFPIYYLYDLDLEKLQDIKKMAVWLKKNSDHFDFANSSFFIEKSHVVTLDQAMKIKVENELTKGNFVKFNVTELKNKGVNFERTDYKQYMQFELSKSKDLTISIIDDYDNSKDCYSFPFLNSILKNNNEKDMDNCKFTFLNMDINGPTLAILVEFSNKVIKLYDYTHNPPNGTVYTIMHLHKFNIPY